MSENKSKQGWIVAVVIAALGSPVIVELIKSSLAIEAKDVKEKVHENKITLNNPLMNYYPNTEKLLEEYFNLAKPISTSKSFDLTLSDHGKDNVSIYITINTKIRNFSPSKNQYIDVALQDFNDASFRSYKYRKNEEAWVIVNTKRSVQVDPSFAEIKIPGRIKIAPGEFVETEKELEVIQELDSEFSLTSIQTVLSGVEYRYRFGSPAPRIRISAYGSTSQFYSGDIVTDASVVGKLSLPGLVLTGQGALFLFERYQP